MRFCTNNFGESHNAERFRLRTLAHALINWNENTGSLNDFEIDPLPHQVHLVHTIMNKGHYNWLIADDVGLGETIETGMLIKAMQQRGNAKRILLVTPAGLTAQWKEEMHLRFKLSDFRIYGEDIKVSAPREWKMYDNVIGSIDRLKDDKHLELLIQAEDWDLVIFDEAHRLSREQYGMKLNSTGRCRLAQQLRRKTRAMVLLSATPTKAKPISSKPYLSYFIQAAKPTST